MTSVDVVLCWHALSVLFTLTNKPRLVIILLGVRTNPFSFLALLGDCTNFGKTISDLTDVLTEQEVS